MDDVSTSSGFILRSVYLEWAHAYRCVCVRAHGSAGAHACMRACMHVGQKITSGVFHFFGTGSLNG